MRNKDIHEHIDHYVDERGFELLAVDDKKRPVTRNGVKDATKDKVRLHCTVNGLPACNLAVATGAASGLVCCDLDVRGGASGEDSLKDMFGEEFNFDYERNLWATTPSGGKHLFFLWDDEFPVKSRIGAINLVDIKSNDGYCLVQPSVVKYASGESGSYVFNDINAPIAKQPKWFKTLVNLPPTHTAGSSGLDVIPCSGLVEGVSQGSRENSIFSLSWALRKGGYHIDVAKSVITTVSANCKPPFNTSEALAKVERAYSFEFNKAEV